MKNEERVSTVYCRKHLHLLSNFKIKAIALVYETG